VTTNESVTLTTTVTKNESVTLTKTVTKSENESASETKNETVTKRTNISPPNPFVSILENRSVNPYI